MRVEQRSERLEALRERWGVPELIEDRRRDVRELGQRVARTEEAFFSVRECRLSGARSVIETIPHRARVKVAERERGLAAERPRLAAAPVRIDAVAADVASAGERGRMGIKRELEDHEHDFGRAIARLIPPVRRGSASIAASAMSTSGLLARGLSCASASIGALMAPIVSFATRPH